MPIKEVSYICSICGSKYDSENAAIECENSHYKLINIKKINYSSKDNKNRYPSSIIVELEDSNKNKKTVTYYRTQQ